MNALRSLGVAIFLGLASLANAVSVNLIPTTNVTAVRPGDTVAFDIILDFTDETTLGGGFDLNFDESQLQLLGFTETVILGDPNFGRPPDYVPGSGLLESWSVGDFNGIVFGLAGSVQFQVRPGATESVVALGPTSGIGGPFVSAVNFICCMNPDFGEVTVSAVPVPAAVWLLVSALGVFWVGVARVGRLKM